MGEQYCECLVSRKPDQKMRLLVVALIALTVLFAAAGIFLWIVFCIPAVACGVVAWFMAQKIQVEYEYLLLDHEISIDAIYGRSRRKKMLNCSTAKIESFQPANPGQIDHLKRQNLKVEDYSAGEDGEARYLMVCAGDKQKAAFLITPNREMLTQLERELPRAVYIR